MPLSDYQSRVTALHRDDTGKITAGERDNAIADAVLKYSQDRPRVKTDDLVAAHSNLLALPAGWINDFSVLRAIEFPIGQYPPALLEADRYRLYTEAGQAWPNKIMLLDAVNIGSTLRASFTLRHQLDTLTDTIRPDDREPICCWAAALCLDQLAALFSGDSYSAIQADAVDHGTKAREYNERARNLRKRYHDLMGIADKSASPATVLVDLDQPDSQGHDRLLHPGRLR